MMGTPDRQDIHGQPIDRHTHAGQAATSSSWGGYAGESSADAERPAQEETATEIDEIIVTGRGITSTAPTSPTRWASAFRSPSCRPR